MKTLQPAGDGTARAFGHQQCARQRGAIQLNAKTAAGRRELQPRVRKNGAQQQQAPGADVGATHRQAAIAVALRQCNPTDGIQGLRAAAQDQPRRRRRFRHPVGAERGADTCFAIRLFGAQRETLAEGEGHLALAQGQLQVDGGGQRGAGRLVHRRG